MGLFPSMVMFRRQLHDPSLPSISLDTPVLNKAAAKPVIRASAKKESKKS